MWEPGSIITILYTLLGPDYNYTGSSSRTTNTVNHSHQSDWSDWDDWTGEDLIVLFVERVLVRAGQKKMTSLSVLGFSFPSSTALLDCLDWQTGTGPAGLAVPSLYHRHGRTHSHRKSYYCLLQLVCSYWGSAGLGTCIVRSDLWEIFLTLIFMKTGTGSVSSCLICQEYLQGRYESDMSRAAQYRVWPWKQNGVQPEYPDDGEGKYHCSNLPVGARIKAWVCRSATNIVKEFA